MAGIKRIKKIRLGRKYKNLQKLKQTLPTLLANQAVNHFKKGFRQGGGQTDGSKGGWKARKRGAPRDRGRALLVDTGALRRDIKKRMVTFPVTKISAGVHPRVNRYASRHNRGLDGMPKREFIGKSMELRRKQKALIRRKVKIAMQ